MGKMTKIALLVAALALPAYADPPATASSGSASTSLGAPADDGSSQLGAKSGVKAHASAGADSHAATADSDAKDYRVDVDANASDKDAKAKPSSHRVKAKAKRGRASAVTRPNAGTAHAVNGGINPTASRDEKVGVGASVTGDDKAAASSAAGANAGDRDTGAKAGINANAGDRDSGAKAGVHAGASAGTGAGAGAEIDDTGAGSNRR